MPERRTEPAAGRPPRPAPWPAWSCLPRCGRPGRSGPRRRPGRTRSSSSRRAPARSSMPVATIMIDAAPTGRTVTDRPLPLSVSSVRRRQHGSYFTRPARTGLSGFGSVSRMRMARKAPGVLQHGQPRVGNGEEPAGRVGQVRRQPRIARAGPRPTACPRPGPGRPGSVRAEDRAAASAAARIAVAAWFSRRRAKRCWDQPPAALRPCTGRRPAFELTSRGGEPAKTPAA